MPDSPDSSSRFSDVGTLDFDDYKPLSVLAIIAFVASFFSLLGLAHPVLWILPVVSLAISLIAFVRLARPASQEGGKTLAILGLLITLLIIGYAPARALSQQQAISHQGREFSRVWLQMVLGGKLKEAHQLTLRSHERETGDLDVAYSITTQEANELRRKQMDEAMNKGTKSNSRPPRPPQGVEGKKDQLEEFVASPDVARLLEFDRGATIRFVEFVEYAGDRERRHVVQRFEVSDGELKPFSLVVFAERSLFRDKADWRVQVKH